MRELEECKAEIFRLGEQKIKEKKKKQKRIASVCISVCICAVLGTSALIFGPTGFSTKKSFEIPDPTEGSPEISGEAYGPDENNYGSANGATDTESVNIDSAFVGSVDPGTPDENEDVEATPEDTEYTSGSGSIACSIKNFEIFGSGAKSGFYKNITDEEKIIGISIYMHDEKMIIPANEDEFMSPQPAPGNASMTETCNNTDGYTIVMYTKYGEVIVFSISENTFIDTSSDRTVQLTDEQLTTLLKLFEIEE